MAKGIIANAAGATTGFFHDTGVPREESISDHALVLSARVLSGPFEGERATITWLGEFDVNAGVAEVREWRESVDGKLHFSLRFDRPVPLEDLLSENFREPLTLIGNRFANVLEGDGTANRLVGNGGADRLVGLRGADDLVGGAGADAFVFRSVRDSTPERRDTIRDFGTGKDLINLKAIDADETHRGNQAFDFIGDGRFSGAAGELRAVVSGKATVILGDTDGDRSADFALRLSGHHTLDADDFVL